jgi:hypothetical protein
MPSLRSLSTADAKLSEGTIWMNPTVEAEQATRRAQVVEALADAVATVDRAPPIHVAVDGLADPATRTLADDLGRVLTGRGRRCRRVTLRAQPPPPGGARGGTTRAGR